MPKIEIDYSNIINRYQFENGNKDKYFGAGIVVCWKLKGAPQGQIVAAVLRNAGGEKERKVQTLHNSNVKSSLHTFVENQETYQQDYMGLLAQSVARAVKKHFL